MSSTPYPLFTDDQTKAFIEAKKGLLSYEDAITLMSNLGLDKLEPTLTTTWGTIYVCRHVKFTTVLTISALGACTAVIVSH